jgi:hypothetical protein
MLIKQHKHKWIILHYAILCFLTDKPAKYYSRSISGYNKMQQCHDGEIGITSSSYKVYAKYKADIWLHIKSDLKARLSKILFILKE